MSLIRHAEEFDIEFIAISTQSFGVVFCHRIVEFEYYTDRYIFYSKTTARRLIIAFSMRWNEWQNASNQTDDDTAT